MIDAIIIICRIQDFEAPHNPEFRNDPESRNVLPSLLASKLSCGVTCSTWNISNRLGPIMFRKFIFCIAYLKASSIDSYSGSNNAAEIKN